MSFILNITKKVIGYKQSPQTEEQKTPINHKNNINQVYNSQDSFRKKSIHLSSLQEAKKIEQFELVLEQSIIDMEKLKKISWQGIPKVYRGKVWKLLLKYIPPNHQSQSSIINKKRRDYQQYIKDYYQSIKEVDRDDNERKIIKIIQADVNRTQPDCDLFRNKQIQDLLSRLLFIYNMRYPMTGYVQGINDIASPLIAVFLNEYIDVDFKEFTVPKDMDKVSMEIFSDIEADTYWCLSKILQSIQDYYIRNQPGVIDAFSKIKDLVKKVDSQLDKVMEQNQIELNHFMFRWVYCLLIREFPLTLAMRILDTYLSEEEGFGELHIYTCTNLLLKCAEDAKQKNFNDMIIFFQNLPTKDWTENQVQMLLAEAYVLKNHYENAHGHFRQLIGTNNSFI